MSKTGKNPQLKSTR